MKDSDLLISVKDNVYSIKVSGRANFEYGVPLREMAKNLDDKFTMVCFDMADCLAMDSTFMGVMTMIGLKAAKIKAEVEILNASPTIQKLLKDLGIARLFTFVNASKAPQAAQTLQTSDKNILNTAETVSEAHKVLVEADSANAAKFDKVIEYADQDVERIKQKQKDAQAKDQDQKSE